ncbi:hypothetical protein, partial [Escherichia albertii]|uniref:hypothetical protein n=1 Tax=Escherichia albertii TaxID=208962 RepID=UPI001C3952BF
PEQCRPDKRSASGNFTFAISLKGTYLRIPFGLPGDRMWFFTHRNDDRPTMKLLPFAGNKV